MTFTIYKLHFNAPLHINYMREDAGISQRTIHSDTLYAALTSCLAKVGESIPPQGDLGCTVSSLFPFYQKDKDSRPTFFLPMPLQSQMPDLQDVSLAKTVKKVQWVDSSLYGLILEGKLSLDEKSEYLDCIYKSFLLNPQNHKHNEGQLLFEDFIISSVTVRGSSPDRTGIEPTVPFYIDRLFFKGYSGMFFIVEGDTSLIEKALNILKDEGLGTDRHVGYGTFDLEKSQLSIDVPKSEDKSQLSSDVPKSEDDTGYWVSLSMLIPEDDNQLRELLTPDNVAYELMRRGGWITTHPYTTYRKNVIYAFMPGSVLCKTSNDMVTGRIVDLTPSETGITIDHKIWRNGKSIMLPIKIKTR